MIEKRTKGGAKTLQIRNWQNRVEETSHVAQRTQRDLKHTHPKTADSTGLETQDRERDARREALRHSNSKILISRHTPIDQIYQPSGSDE